MTDRRARVTTRSTRRVGYRLAVRRRSLPLLLALVAAAAPAQAADEDGPLLGDRYRYARMNVVARALSDVVAIPANVGSWDGGDWAQLALWSGAVAAPWLAGDPSLDVRLDRWSRDVVNPAVPTVWNDVTQPLLWGSIAVGGFATWGWATWTGHDDVAQGCSLMGESLAVAQVYHLSLKFLIGRDGPQDGDGLGRVKGPANALAIYPGGTPSGHAATLFSLTSAGFAYFRPPAWAQVIGYGLVGGLVAFHVVDHRHFLSESIAGSAIGWYVGRWVVRHRASSRYGEPDRAPRVAVVPSWVGGGAGVVATGRF